MNQQLQEKCQLFIANRDAIKENFKWENEYIIPACSMLYTEKDTLADKEALMQCNDIVKKEAGIFSNFRGNVKMVLITKMELSDNPKQYFDKVVKIYNLLKKDKWCASEYTVIAAMTIADYEGDSEPEEIVEKVRILYAQMKENHPFLTSEEDTSFAALLAMSELEELEVLEEMEICFNALKPKFSSSNAVQSLSHILALDTRDTEAKCRGVLELYELLKKKGKKYDSSSLSILGGLNMIDLPNEELVSEIVEVDEYLKKQKGFGVFGIGGSQRLLYATALVMNSYTSERTNMQAMVLTSTVAVMIAEQMAMMAAIMAANASMAASSN